MLNRDTYLSAFERFSAGLPVAERQARGDALQRFLDIGLPSTDEEAWKYTDFSKLAGESVSLTEPGPSPDLSAWQIAGAQTQVWLNGSADAQNDAAAAPLRDAPGDDTAHPGFAALNAAFARPGLQLDLPAGTTRSQPLQALFVTQPQHDGAMVHLRHRIRLADNASATVLLHDVGLNECTRWVTQTLELELGANAQLQLIRLQDESTGTRGWFQASAQLHAGARLNALQIDFGGAMVRNDWRVRLLAPQAFAALHGLFAPTGRSHVDNHTLIEHLAPHCTSREYCRGLAWERAQAVFNGKIVVHPGAQKTDSEQRLANLLLSKHAVINAKPELEIYADDVKCAHGATFGRLDPTALFYLRTRGVPEAAARALLTFSFANEILQRITWPELRQAVSTRFLARMGGGFDAGEQA